MEATRMDYPALLGRLWRLESGLFVEYVLGSSSPELVDEADKAVSDVFRQAGEEASRVREALVRAYRARSLRVPSFSFPLWAPTFNFVRASALARPFLRMVERDLPMLEEAKEQTAGAVTLEDRLVRDVVTAQQKMLASAKAGLDAALGKAKAASAESTSAAAETKEAAPAAAGANGPPWHDEALSLEERMALVKGMGIFEQLFAAMAQTDCTACGYDCEGYARAIADGEDADLTKCAPGELETQQMLEKIMGKK